MPGNSRDPKIPYRKSIRLMGYDYSQGGAYFVTICTTYIKNLFGKIIDGEMILNHLGIIAKRELLELHNTYPNVEINDDEFVVMPDHIHAILWKTDVGASQRLARNPIFGPTLQSLREILGQYKSRVTKGINLLRKTPGKSVWQRNYYDRIIRDEKELLAIKKYITDNPCSGRRTVEEERLVSRDSSGDPALSRAKPRERRPYKSTHETAPSFSSLSMRSSSVFISRRWKISRAWAHSFSPSFLSPDFNS